METSGAYLFKIILVWSPGIYNFSLFIRMPLWSILTELFTKQASERPSMSNKFTPPRLILDRKWRKIHGDPEASQACSKMLKCRCKKGCLLCRDFRGCQNKSLEIEQQITTIYDIRRKVLKIKCVKLNKKTPWCKRAQSITAMSRGRSKKRFVDTYTKLNLSYVV